MKAPEVCPYGVPVGYTGKTLWGDLIEKIAKPIARALHLKCLDDKGKLKPESNCAKRKAALNKLTT